MITIDKEKITINNVKEISMYSSEAFELITELWLKIGWANKYSYQFTWLGRPIIQLPEDLLRIQEIIYKIKPTLIIETGVAHGGSLIYYASLLKLIGGRQVIGIDINIHDHNKAAIEQHELSSYIALIEGSSVEPDVVGMVKSKISKDDTVLVILDSNHSYEHVLNELALYSSMVSVGSYIVATDGIMKDLSEVPGSSKSWQTDNPQNAVEEFLQKNSNFILESPPAQFDKSTINKKVTYWPNGWLKKIK